MNKFNMQFYSKLYYVSYKRYLDSISQARIAYWRELHYVSARRLGKEPLYLYNVDEKLPQILKRQAI